MVPAGCRRGDPPAAPTKAMTPRAVIGQMTALSFSAFSTVPQIPFLFFIFSSS